MGLFQSAGPPQMAISDGIPFADEIHFHSSKTLPTEVCEQIIDAVTPLGRIDTKLGNLVNCALVCRSWLPRSRRCLYSSIALDTELKTRQLISTLSTSPSLGCLVKELIIDAYDRSREVSSFSWVYSAVTSLPPFLKDLKTLWLWYLPSLHSLFPILCSRFSTVQYLRLIEMHHCSFREIVQIVQRFPRLRRLDLVGCIWRRPGSHFGGKQLMLDSLTVLDIADDGHSSGDILRWILATHSSSSLSHLRWIIPLAFSGPEPQQLVRSCTRTLRSVSLEFHGTGTLEGFVHRGGKHAPIFRDVTHTIP